MSRPPNDFTYKNRLVFDSNSYLPELKFYSTYEITNILENSPVYDNNDIVGRIKNVTHKNASLFYGDLHLHKEYPEDCHIVYQLINFNLKIASFEVKSYICKEEQDNG